MIQKQFVLFMMISLILFLLTSISTQGPQECEINIPRQIEHQALVSQFIKEHQSNKAYLKQWMNGIKDSTIFSQLSIPGTHDSGAYDCDYFKPCHIYQCQSMSIYEQLNRGIRHLDIRVNSQTPLTVGHQAIEFTLFSTVAEDIKHFLEQNPSEMISVAFQRNSGEHDPSRNIIEQLERLNISFILAKKPLIVGEVRGKVWIICGLGIDFGFQTYRLEGLMGITNTSEIYLQNYWQVGHHNVSRKCLHALSTAFGVDCEQYRVKFNFLSGSVLIQPFELVMQKKGPNNRFLQWLLEDDEWCLGVTIMDFPSTQLIERIISTNFKVRELQ